MARTTIAAVSVILLALSGCAGGKGYPTSHPGAGYEGSGYEYGPASGSGATTSDRGGYRPASTRAPAEPGSAPRGRYHRSGVTVPPPAPGAPSPAYRYRPPVTRRIVRPSFRPGLATVFGERVRSRVTFTSFSRARTRPEGLVAIHYNDYQGLVTMTRHLRQRCCGNVAPHRVRAGITVQLVDSYGRPLRGVQVGGRTIVMGQANTRYGILVQSYSGARFEIVASVDGLDVIDGRRASFAKRGYILPAHGRLLIRGFRTSHYNVAAFRFGSVANSYAARTGNARNVGVVGVAAFSEYRAPQDQSEVIRRLGAQPFAQPPR